jgi:hypothetical protein
MTTHILKKVVEKREEKLGTLFCTTYDQYIARVPEFVTLSNRSINVMSSSFYNELTEFQNLVWFLENNISFDEAREEIRKMYKTLSNYRHF